jgi:MFS family permease
LWAWVLLELRVAEPVVDMRMFVRPAMLSTTVATFVFGFASLISFVALVTMVQAEPADSGYGFSATVLQAGLYVLPSSLVQFAMAFAAARLGRLFSLRQLIVAGTLVGAFGLALFAIAHSQSWHIYLFSLVYGAGFGLSFACIPPRLVDTVAAEDMASASATNAVLFNVSQVLGGAVLAGTLAAATHLGASTPTDSGYRLAGLIGAAAAVVGAAVFVHQTRLRPGTA